MKFASLEEYFYKLQNILLLILLLPLVSFIYLVMGHLEKFDAPESMTAVTTIMLSFIAVIDWIITILLFNRMVNKISKLIGLSLKLERYYYATLMRYCVGVTACLVLALGFYLTDSSIFLILFAVAIILFFITWPRPAKVCSDLKLKGDEREMVLYKKHSL